MKSGIILITVLCCRYAFPAFAEPVYEAHVKTDLVSDYSAITPGQTFWVGLKLEMDPGWHTYWRNSGDSGMPTSITWELPDGFKASGIHWPIPKKFDYENGLVGYGYEGQVVLLTEIQTPAEVEGSSMVTLTAKVKWLACAEICVPGQAVFSLPMVVFAKEALVHEEVQAFFNEQQERLPVNTSDWKIEAVSRDEDYLFRFIPSAGWKSIIKSAIFFPYRNDIINHAAQQSLSEDDAGRVELSVKKSNLSDEWVQEVRGLMVIDQITPDGEQNFGIMIDVPVIDR